MNSSLDRLVRSISVHDGINDKMILATIIRDEFNLVKDRSVFYCQHFAIRFSASLNLSFANTVLSLSNLQKFDDRPFIVCLVTPSRNYLLLANTTFLKKISHSSQELRENNILGSFNGSDIVRDFEGITNSPENFDRLFNIHSGLGFDGNFVRLVEATNDISPSGKKFEASFTQQETLLLAPERAIRFAQSEDAVILKRELDLKVDKFKNEILIAALIENVNVRGRIIEYLIAGEDESIRQEIISALQKGSGGIPPFKTKNSLGDYSREFKDFLTATDVKTKIMILNSNPKAYNLDKMLEFLASDRSVFMFYFVGIDSVKIINTVLVSIFQEQLLNATILLKHWAGRNSRGVSQFEGKTISHLIMTQNTAINHKNAITFLNKIIEL